MKRRIWCAVAIALTIAFQHISGAQVARIDPYGLPVVQAACGKEGMSAASFPKSSPVETPLYAGRARIYIITGSWKFIGRAGDPVVLGIDGRWFAANRGRHFSFSFVDVEPGIHHLCVTAHVSGVLPNSSAAVALAQVNAKAGQTYYFYNHCVNLMHILTLVPINRETGEMYAEAIPPADGKIPKLWNTRAAQQACGPDPKDMPAGSPPPPTLPGPPTQGMALIYLYSGELQYNSRQIMRVAIDGRWVASMRANSYAATEVKPGAYRICTQANIALSAVHPTLWLGKVQVEAGKTYFVNTNTLEEGDENLVTSWLKRIAAMPKSDAPPPKALVHWVGCNSHI